MCRKVCGLFNSLHKFALGFQLSTVFLIESDVVCLSNTAKFLQETVRSINEVICKPSTLSKSYICLLGEKYDKLLSVTLYSCYGDYPVSEAIAENFSFVNNLRELRLRSMTSLKSVKSKACAFSKLHSLRTLELSGVLDEGMTILSFVGRCPDLYTLQLEKCPFLEDSHINSMFRIAKDIKCLIVSMCLSLHTVNISLLAKSLQQCSIVKCPNVSSLRRHISQSVSISAKDTEQPPLMGRLNKLDVSMSGVTAAGLSDLLAVSPSLQSLTAAQCCSLSGALSIKNSYLTSLDLRQCEGVSHLVVSGPSLKRLNLDLCGSLVALQLNSGALDSLRLSGLSTLVYLHLQCPELRSLDLCGCHNLGVEPWTATAAASGAYLQEPSDTEKRLRSGVLAAIATDAATLHASKEADSPQDEQPAFSPLLVLMAVLANCPRLDRAGLAANGIGASSVAEYGGHIIEFGGRDRRLQGGESCEVSCLVGRALGASCVLAASSSVDSGGSRRTGGAPRARRNSSDAGTDNRA